MKNITEVLVLVMYLAMLFTLVRRNSQGPTLVTNAGNALSNLVTAATGGGSF